VPNSSGVVGRIHHVQNVLLARAAAPLSHVKILKHNADIAHGVLMGVAVVLLFPIGAIITRLSKSRHMFCIHVGCQISGLVVLLGGFATGIWTSIIHDEVNSNYGLLRAMVDSFLF
jgi:hypothetical protein